MPLELAHFRTALVSTSRGPLEDAFAVLLVLRLPTLWPAT